jgi:hypothetical protein
MNTLEGLKEKIYRNITHQSRPSHMSLEGYRRELLSEVLLYLESNAALLREAREIAKDLVADRECGWVEIWSEVYDNPLENETVKKYMLDDVPYQRAQAFLAKTKEGL